MIKSVTKTIALALALVSLDVIAGTHPAFHFAQGITQKDYLPNTLVLKVKPEFRSQCSNANIEIQALQQIFTGIGVVKINKIFPHHQPPAESFDKYGRAYIDLSLIYQLEYAKGEMPKIINSLMRTDLLEYAEPKYT